MILLYDAGTLDFSTNGVGALSDSASCKVTEERNGEYELEMQYPVSGAHYEEIALRSIITAKPTPTGSPQPFRVYQITKPINGIVTVYAAHISYDLSGVPIGRFEAGSAAAAMSGLDAFAAVEHPFTFWTDKTTEGSFSVKSPASIRSRLGGNEGSILDAYGGEFEFDGFTVRLYQERGMDRGVSIRYGKNLTDLAQEENCANVYTGVYPYWTDGESVVELPEKILYAEGVYNYTRILTLDLSDAFEEPPGVDNLRKRAERYMEENGIGIPRVSLKLSFVQLEQSEEYKNLALLERVSLCDTVHVQFPALGVSASAKCIRTVYDVLLNRFESVELGDARPTIADTITAQNKALANVPTPSSMRGAILNATEIITGNRGGYVILHSSTGQREPDEILIMDAPSIEEAVRVWRWNNSGLGYSSTGYNGPYGLAMTIDGSIVASFITTGTMSAARVRTGTLESEDGRVVIDLTSGTITIRGADGSTKLLFDMAGNLSISGHITATSGSIGAFTIDAGGNLAGAASLKVGGMTFSGNKAAGLKIGVDNLSYVNGQPAGSNDAYFLMVTDTGVMCLADLYIEDGSLVITTPGHAPSQSGTVNVVQITSMGDGLVKYSSPSTSSSNLGICRAGEVYGYTGSLVSSGGLSWINCNRKYTYSSSTARWTAASVTPFYIPQASGGETFFVFTTVNA